MHSTLFLISPKTLDIRGFINVFSWRTTGFHRQAKFFDLNFFVRKSFFSMGKPSDVGKSVFTASLFTQCPTLDETLPDIK